MASKTDGQVLYEIRGDDSYLDQDLSAAQQKVEESVGKAGESTKAMASKVVMGVGAAMATATVAVGTAAVNSANDIDQAMNQYIASTGKAVEETERYQNVLENIYKNNYGEDFGDIAAAMAQVNKQLGDMPDDQLQTVVESAFALRDVFEYDVAESTRAAKAMMDNFGVSGEEAMSMIAAGAQNGLDYSGELIDSISEYSVQFAKLGFDANDMFKIFQKGADSGAWNLDKIGDAIKELSIRAMDGSDATKKAFDDLGFEDLTEEFAAGGERAREAFEIILYELDGMQDKVKQNEIGVALFGTMWEDLGPEVVGALVDIEEGAYDAADAMNSIKEVKYEDLGSMFEGLKRSVEMLLVPLGEQLIPVLNELIEQALPVLEELIPPVLDLMMAAVDHLIPLVDELLPPLLELMNALLPIFDMAIQLLQPLIEMFEGLLPPIAALISDAVVPLIEIILELISLAIEPLQTVIGLLARAFSESMNGMFSSVRKIIGNLMDIFEGLIDFITGVFTGDWERAWNGVSKIFKGIAEGFRESIKIPINWIIDGINGFLGGLNGIKIPDWVPLVGGKSFNISLIPRLKKGMDFVPSDYYPAFLDYGERVLTQQENRIYTALGGLEGMAQLNQGGMRPIRIETTVVLNDREIARASAEYTSEQQAWEEL